MKKIPPSWSSEENGDVLLRQEEVSLTEKRISTRGFSHGPMSVDWKYNPNDPLGGKPENEWCM